MVKKILAESKSHRGKRSPIRDPSSFQSFLRLCNSISTTFAAMEMVVGKAPTPLRSRPSSIPVFHPRQITRCRFFTYGPPILPILCILFSFSLSLSLRGNDEVRRWEKVVYACHLSGFSIFFFFHASPRARIFPNAIFAKKLVLSRKKKIFRKIYNAAPVSRHLAKYIPL